MQEAFDLWLGNGKVADVNRERLDPADSISLVHRHGGVVFIAHPVYMGDEYGEVVSQLADCGADGIETYYKNYSAATVEYHEQLGARHHLARSGGSDYHGLGNSDDRDIGDIPFPLERVQEFIRFIEANCSHTGKRVH